MATFTRWIRGFCHDFFPFFHDYILLQKSPRATFCHFVNILLCSYWMVS